MTCTELKALAPAYAIGALNAPEREACEAHLAEQRPHDGCHSALASAEGAAALLVEEFAPVNPSAQVWDRIERAIAAEPVPAAGGQAMPVWRRALGGLALAASVAVVYVLLGRSAANQHKQDARDLQQMTTTVTQERTLAQTTRDQLGAQVARCRQDLDLATGQVAAQSKALSLLGAPRTQLVSLAPAKGLRSSGTVIFNSRTHDAVVMASALSPSAGHDYELWVIRGKDKIAAGLLKLEAQGVTLALVDEKLLTGGVDAFAITLEPAGGSIAPRGSIVLVGAVKKT